MASEQTTKKQAVNLGLNNFQVRELDGGLLAIVFDPKFRIGPSTSGKTLMVATSRGFVTLPGGLKLSLNVTADKVMEIA